MVEKGTMLRFIAQPHIWDWSMDLVHGNVYEVKDMMNNAPCIVDNINEPVLIFHDRMECFEVVELEQLPDIGTVLKYLGSPLDRWCNVTRKR